MIVFRGTKLKIERANQHIGELASALRFYLQTDFYRLSIEKNAEGSDVLTLETVGTLPPQVPLIIGDALHNLHSALDHLAYEIVASTGRTPSRQLFFPFAGSRDELIETLHDGEIEAAAGRALIDLIVDTVRPYKGGNDALYGLHRIDIVDKHKLLVPLVSIAALRNVSGEDSNGSRFQGMTLMVGEGGKLNAIAMSGTMKITDYGVPAFAVMFGKGEAFEGDPVIPTLHQLTQLVSGVVDTIEKSYTRGGQVSP